jgi:hypothetical protein
LKTGLTGATDRKRWRLVRRVRDNSKGVDHNIKAIEDRNARFIIERNQRQVHFKEAEIRIVGRNLFEIGGMVIDAAT